MGLDKNSMITMAASAVGAGLAYWQHSRKDDRPMRYSELFSVMGGGIAAGFGAGSLAYTKIKPSLPVAAAAAILGGYGATTAPMMYKGDNPYVRTAIGAGIGYVGGAIFDIGKFKGGLVHSGVMKPIAGNKKALTTLENAIGGNPNSPTGLFVNRADKWYHWGEKLKTGTMELFGKRFPKMEGPGEFLKLAGSWGRMPEKGEKLTWQSLRSLLVNSTSGVPTLAREVAAAGSISNLSMSQIGKAMAKDAAVGLPYAVGKAMGLSAIEGMMSGTHSNKRLNERTV